jgi:hypothetical protein
MSPRSKREYLTTIHKRYKAADRKGKRAILDEFCQNCGYHRKHAIRLLNGIRRRPKANPRKPGKPSIYAIPELIKILENIWLASDMPCGKRLKVILPAWLPYYGETFGGVNLKVILALKKISATSLDRLLAPARRKHKSIALSTTKPGTLLRSHIPVKTGQWEESEPGFLEADTVAHCGTSAAGQFVCTLDAVDIATGWTEQRAVWGTGERDVLEQLKDIEASLPFPLRGLDTDNGHEFLNWHLVKYCQERKEPVLFTRSRAYKKDDNAHIEQKNFTHVRQRTGYDRFDRSIIKDLLNDVYTNELRLFNNFFIPSMKLLEKRRVRSKIIKKHDKAKTPYQRILEHPSVAPHRKAELTKTFQKLNPFKLRLAIDKKLAKIRSLASKCPLKLNPSLGNILQ